MANLVAIGFTVVAGVSVFSVSIVSFGVAMKHQCTFIAARCVARPRTVIYNPSPTVLEAQVQDRGNPLWGWIPWVMRLTYATMLSGVPGTGTREGGLSGLMLKVNLDGIVLMRFHHLCLRVCTLAAFLYLMIVLPVYQTAQCSRIGGDHESQACLGQNLTDYQRLTLANIPPLAPSSTVYDTFGDVVKGFFDPIHGGILARLYAVVFCSWLVTLYAYTELDVEWRDVLALRRVYFLEADHWKDRNAEHEETLLRQEREKSEGYDNPMTQFESNDKSYVKNRDPWVPHPEQRDTIPNIELYSVLVGGLPSLPTEAFVQEEVEAVFSRKQAIDWQLAVTTAFFDHCVPNQPGFSSSVAAVTILPAASQITGAWNHWYKAAAKLRRLRFIRRQIAKLRKKEGDNNANNNCDIGSTEVSDLVDMEQVQSTSLGKMKKKEKRRLKIGRNRKRKKAITVYTESDEKAQYYREVLGTTDDLDVENNLLHALKLGPEQTAVYSREFAQGAANIAPYGWNEEKIRRASLPELLQMEKVAARAVEEANLALRRAQEKIAEHSSDGNISDEDVAQFMRQASTHVGSGMDTENDHNEDELEVSSSNEMMRLKDSFNNKEKDHNASEDILNSTAFSSSSSGGVSFADQESINNELPDTAGIETKPQRRSLLESFTPKIEFVDQIVDLSVTTFNQSIQNLGSIAQNFVPERRNSMGNNIPRKMSRASFSSLQLPDNLGLEAGLFLEQKNLFRCHSQHTPRSSAPRRSRSSDNIDALEKETGDGFSTSLHQERREFWKAPPRRIESSDGIDILKNVLERDESLEASQSTPNITSPLQQGQKTQAKSLLREPAPTLVPLLPSPPKDLEECKKANNKESQEIGAKNEYKSIEDKVRKESIWDRIARENQRRSILRSRLSSLSGTSNDGKGRNEGKDNAASSDAPMERKSFLIPSESDHESTTDERKLSSTKHVNFLAEPHIEANDVENQVGKVSKGHGMGPIAMKAIKELDDSEASMSFNDSTADDGLGLTHPLDNSKTEVSSNAADENLRLAFDFEEKAGLRRRQSNSALKRLSKKTNEKWLKVVQIVKETSRNRDNEDGEDPIANGAWTKPAVRAAYDSFLFSLEHIFKPVRWTLQSSDLVDHLASESHYAVVTFTSRQAAVAARLCLADSRGADRWKCVSEMPSPPLADAPVCSASGFRGCVRPVTISINDKQKMLRHYLALALLATIYFFYTFPLTKAQQLLSPEMLGKIIPDLNMWLQNSFLKYIFTGLIPALVWTAFFAICPPMFKMIANFGSNATSSPFAEGSALRYFWWFMVVSAFTGTSLSSAIIDSFNSGINIGYQAQAVVVNSAAAIPTEVSSTWLNWMIVRVTMVLPTQYLLQLNTFLFTWLGLKCCARTVRGGGSGGPVPYRIYVDSGVVMLCLFALAPASPLIAAAAFFYFLFCVPMLRWTMIFLYKPKFDIGGKRFPFIFDMCVSGMLVGQILLVTMMALRRAFGPAFAAFLPIIPTISYRWLLRRRYLRAFDDVALLQTSLLDGWDTNEESSVAKREEFRQFLVDCHKAAYVPVCIASDAGSEITSEPAVVVPLDTDFDEDYDDDMTSVNGESVYGGSMYGGGPGFVHGGSVYGGGGSVFGGGSVTGKMTVTPVVHHLYHSYQPLQQPGRMMRRTGPAQPLPTTPTVAHEDMVSHIHVSGDSPGFLPSPHLSSPQIGRTVNTIKVGAPRPPHPTNTSHGAHLTHSPMMSPRKKYFEALPSVQKMHSVPNSHQLYSKPLNRLPDLPEL